MRKNECEGHFFFNVFNNSQEGDDLIPHFYNVRWAPPSSVASILPHSRSQMDATWKVKPIILAQYHIFTYQTVCFSRRARYRWFSAERMTKLRPRMRRRTTSHRKRWASVPAK